MSDKQLLIMKPILIIGTMLFLYLQFHYLFKPGGTLELYGFFGSFEAFGRVSLADPITAAAFVDLVGLMLLVGLVIINGVPRGPGYALKITGLMLVLIVWPALAMLLYLIFFWRRTGQFQPTSE
nr:hypothetical protein [Sphingomonas sp. CDS-1]